MNKPTKAQELTVATGKGILSQVPFIGPIAVEWLNVTLPNRRLDRVETMLAHFAAKTSNLPPDFLKEKLQDPEFADLFEESVYSAAKAMSDERLKVIANILSAGLTDDANATIARKCIKTLEDLDDIELALFYEITHKYNVSDAYSFNSEWFGQIKARLLERFAGTRKIILLEVEGVIQESLNRLFRLSLIGSHTAKRNYLSGEDVPTEYYGLDGFGQTFLNFITGWEYYDEDLGEE